MRSHNIGDWAAKSWGLSRTPDVAQYREWEGHLNTTHLDCVWGGGSRGRTQESELGQRMRGPPGRGMQIPSIIMYLAACICVRTRMRMHRWTVDTDSRAGLASLEAP